MEALSKRHSVDRVSLRNLLFNYLQETRTMTYGYYFPVNCQPVTNFKCNSRRYLWKTSRLTFAFRCSHGEKLLCCLLCFCQRGMIWVWVPERLLLKRFLSECECTGEQNSAEKPRAQWRQTHGPLSHRTTPGKDDVTSILFQKQFLRRSTQSAMLDATCPQL